MLNIKNSTFLKFKNFDIDREISLLIGREIFITQNDINRLKLFIPIEQNYLGYKVFRDQEILGIVSDFFETPANKVLEVSDKTGKEILIPFVQDIFEKIDSENKELVLKSNYGFYDDEDLILFLPFLNYL